MATPTPSATSRENVASSNNILALKLYHSLRSENANNMVFSPLSLFTSLSMTYMGARGNTAKQMEAVMDLESLGENIHDGIKDHNSDLLSKYDPNPDQYILKIANRLYGQKKYQFQSEFMDATQQFYSARLEALDFGNTEGARAAINNWVEEQTKSKIRDLIPPGVLTPDTRLVLVNAIYLKAEWSLPFNERLTSNQHFHLKKTEKIKVPMMTQTNHFDYYHDKLLKCKILRLGFQGNQELGMMFILPDSMDGYVKLETKISPKAIQNWSSEIESRVKVAVSLPKFRFTQDFSLAQKLNSIGMNDLFSKSTADLTGISKKDDLYVSDVIHKAFLEINESGCEAAGATAVSMGVKKGFSLLPESKPKVFKADHPFLFFIQSIKSGAFMFMGRVTRS